MKTAQLSRLAAGVLILCFSARAQLAITISPATLPNWTVNTAYSQTLTASNCLVSCTWSYTGTLPTGLSLSGSGVISGTPTATGTFSFTVQAADLVSSGSQLYTVVINQAPSITTGSLPNGNVNTAYSQTVSVANGTAPYSFSVSAGMLPSGLTLNPSSGLISGTANTAGSSGFTITVTDSAKATASQAYTITVNSSGSSLSITTASPLPGGTVGSAYSQTLAATGGTQPYTWSITTGALPAGLSLNATTGALSGTPTKVGVFTFTVQVSDTASHTALKLLTITVVSGPPTPELSISGVAGTADSAQQITFDVMLSSSHSSTVTGQATLTFQPDATAPKDDPAIQFSTGGRSVNFTIPANTTHALFPSTPMAFQTGTVSGTITLSITSDLPGGNVDRPIVVARAAPVLRSVTVVNSSSGFQVQAVGYSNSRDLADVSLHFTPAAGQNLQTTDLTVKLTDSASQWYASDTSAQFGGQFLLVLPFTIQQGNQSALSSVGVQLRNAQGTSATVTANF